MKPIVTPQSPPWDMARFRRDVEALIRHYRQERGEPMDAPMNEAMFRAFAKAVDTLALDGQE